MFVHFLTLVKYHIVTIILDDRFFVFLLQSLYFRINKADENKRKISTKVQFHDRLSYGKLKLRISGKGGGDIQHHYMLSHYCIN